MHGPAGETLIRVWLPGLILALACVILIRLVSVHTGEKIADNRQEAVLRGIGDILPGPYNNDPLAEVREIVDTPVFESSRPVNIYTTRQDGRIQGFVFLPITAQGYNGPVQLAVGVHRDGRLSGVRVLEQHETAGLGDNVDQRHSDWIHGFRGRSLGNTPPAHWTVRKDGGDFDRLSGATITSRGVIKGARKVLDYYQMNRQQLLETGD